MLQKTGGNLVITKESLAKLYPVVIQKAKHVNELCRFPNSVKVWTGFFSLFTQNVKREIKGKK